jgi:hypothetical protein
MFIITYAFTYAENNSIAVKRMPESTKMAGEMSVNIIGLNTGKAFTIRKD